MLGKLTERQKRIINLIVDHIDEKGFPPTFREIGRALRISSTNGVRSHLKAIERKGYLKLSSRSRAIEVADEIWERRGIPILGQVPAGTPLLSDENREGYLDMESFFGSIVPLSHKGERLGSRCRVTSQREVVRGIFALRVKGESMKDAGIRDGDYVIVRKQPRIENGEIGVAFVDGEATVKRFYKEKNGWRLQPENEAMKSIFIGSESRDFRIGGRVIGVLRRL